MIFSWRELRKVTKDLTLHYERKLFLLDDTPENRRLIGKYLEIFQFPDGRVEIRVAGRALPYSVYEKLGAIVENKRLGHMLQVAQLVQAKRDSRAVDVPSTAHRADGTRVPRTKLVDSKSQRKLGPEDSSKEAGGLMRTIPRGAPVRLLPRSEVGVSVIPRRLRERRARGLKPDTTAQFFV